MRSGKIQSRPLSCQLPVDRFGSHKNYVQAICQAAVSENTWAPSISFAEPPFQSSCRSPGHLLRNHKGYYLRFVACETVCSEQTCPESS